MSADALVAEDMEYLKTLPNFKKYLAGGAAIERVRSIYPTITYPCHTTMSTGCYPDRHGIPGNLKSPYRYTQTPIPWIWEHDAVKVPDIFDAAKANGLTNAAVFWPCTGNHPNIDWLIDEYWTQTPIQTLAEAFTEMGMQPELIPIVEKNSHLMVERTHPMCDNFIVSCAADIIRCHKPDLMMLHPANIDGSRHQSGLFGKHIASSMEDTDRWIGELMQAAEDAGVLDETSFVLTSDHGQMDIKRVINLNVFLRDAGLIRSESDWDVWIQSGGMSACVYLRDKTDRGIYEKTRTLLEQMCEEGIYGIGRVFTADEAREEEHYAGDFSFVLEADGYTAFGDAIVRPVVTANNNEDYRKGRATHGYLPAKGPMPVFYAKGPAFRDGVVLSRGKLVDEAPTIARALNIEMENTDGEPVFSILNA